MIEFIPAIIGATALVTTAMLGTEAVAHALRHRVRLDRMRRDLQRGPRHEAR